MRLARLATIAVLAGAALAAPTAASASAPVDVPSRATAGVTVEPAQLFVDFPAAVAPGPGIEGTLPFLTWPPAQGGYGYEGPGYRIFLDRLYAGPGTYTLTLQKIGPGFSAAYPDGTTIVDANNVKRHPLNGNDKQVVTVLPALPPVSSKKLGTEVSDAPPPGGDVPADPADGAAAAVPAADATSARSMKGATGAARGARPDASNAVPLARTGYDEGTPTHVPAMLVAGAVLGTAAAVVGRRARA